MTLVGLFHYESKTHETKIRIAIKSVCGFWGPCKCGVLMPEAVCVCACVWEGGGVSRKLESILYCNNGITVANKAGISAPLVAFQDPAAFFFPMQPGPHHLKIREIAIPPPGPTPLLSQMLWPLVYVCAHLTYTLERIAATSHQKLSHHSPPAVCSNVTRLHQWKHFSLLWCIKRTLTSVKLQEISK